MNATFPADPLPTTSIRRRVKRRSRRGTYTVEFALCVPILFLIFFGTLELARFMYIRQALDQTSYEAAREGVVSGGSVADVQARAAELLSAYGVSDSTVTVSPATINEQTTEVTVTISCNFASNSWTGAHLSHVGDLVSTVTLDHENQAFLVPEAARQNETLTTNNEPLDI